MSIIQGNALGAAAAYQIANSVRFRSTASAYLSRTFNTPTNSNVFTYSAFIKRGSLGGTFRLLGASTTTYLTFNSSDQINLTLNGVSAATSTAVFRDTSAHYHVVYQQNGASQTIWVNNVSVATGTTAAAIFNTAIVHQIGAANTLNFFDGYLSEINFIDGQALTPSSFGEISAEHGQWVPKKYSGTYGTNGFYLPFNDGSNLTNLCLDRSGNGNNWSATGVSLTAGATYDWMLDTPTNNYATLNAISPASLNSAVLNSGNLSATLTFSSQVNAFANQPLPTSGKWYWETEVTSSSLGVAIGVDSSPNASGLLGSPTAYAYYNATGNKYLATVSSAYGTPWFGASRTDVIGTAYDAGTGQLSFYLNGVSQGVAATLTTGVSYFPSSSHTSGSGSHTENWNFGQRPFTYTPPTGFKSLCTANISAPTIVNPKQHFDTVLATGANIKTTTEAVFPSNFFEWIKDRANANNHQLIDTVRGSSAVLQSNTTAIETTYSAPGGSSVGWVWKAGGAAVANNAGSIASQVSANPTAGFSIVTYTGTGVNATVGHGLGVAPRMVIVKDRTNAATDWHVYHSACDASPQGQYLKLNLTSAKTASSTVWNNTQPSSSVFSLGVSASNTLSANFVSYCFAEVPGFSKIGSYIGNGATDGPFVYCGFKPRFVMIKRTDATGNWRIVDTARSTYNANGLDLYPNLSNAEGAVAFDFLSNGFKPRVTDADYNTNGGSYIFYAVAESPFNYSTAR